MGLVVGNCMPRSVGDRHMQSFPEGIMVAMLVLYVLCIASLRAACVGLAITEIVLPV